MRVAWLLFASISWPCWAFCETPSNGGDAKYKLGPHDQIYVHVAQVEEIPTRPLLVGLDGAVRLPLVGRIAAGGRTVEELEGELRRQYGEYVKEPRVTVEIVGYGSQPVSVVGSVNKPGVLQVQGSKSLAEILSLAGGLRPDAGPVITITRRAPADAHQPDGRRDPSGQYLITEINVKELLNGTNPAANVLVEPEDVISVPKAEAVYVIGEVRKPGGFPLSDRKGMGVLLALSLAEGFSKNAAPQHGRILRRRENSTERDEIPVNLKEILAGKEKEPLLVHDDILLVPNHTAKAISWRVLEAMLQVGTGVAIWRVGSIQ